MESLMHGGDTLPVCGGQFVLERAFVQVEVDHVAEVGEFAREGDDEGVAEVDLS